MGRRIVEVDAVDPDWVKRTDPATLSDAMVEATVVGTRRIGKLMLVDLDSGVTVGLRFGMTGRLVVDGAGPIDELVYGASSGDPKWNRFAVRFDHGDLVVHDPRRLGGVELEPDVGRLGPDAAAVTLDELRTALGSSRAALKSRLMDQSRLAGLGNLLSDEILWRAGLAPTREAGGLSEGELGHLAETILATIDDLTARGGSHTGDLQDERAVGASASDAGYCPRDGAALRREQVGGRTTVWCPSHQR